MNKISVVITILLLGIALDLATTFYGLSRNYFETREFSFILKIALLPIACLFVLLKLRPDFLDKIVMSFSLSFGLVFILVSIQNLMVML